MSFGNLIIEELLKAGTVINFSNTGLSGTRSTLSTQSTFIYCLYK